MLDYQRSSPEILDRIVGKENITVGRRHMPVIGSHITTISKDFAAITFPDLPVRQLKDLVIKGAGDHV